MILPLPSLKCSGMTEVASDLIFKKLTSGQGATLIFSSIANTEFYL